MASSKAVEFFKEHAGYGYDPATETPELGKLRGARALADAEQAAREQGFTYEWENRGLQECIGCDCGNDDCPCFAQVEHDSYIAILYNEDGDVLASLGSICQPSRHYRRVVEAELALEVI